VAVGHPAAAVAVRPVCDGGGAGRLARRLPMEGAGGAIMGVCTRN
jgi:hypothetical protein